MQLLAALALGLMLLAKTTCGQKYNLTSVNQSSLVASNTPPGVECDTPGICFPVNQTIQARSLWFWCGFQTTHRTTYLVKSVNKQNFTTMYMMRRRELEECALPNVTWVGNNCESVPESSCSSKSVCDVRLFGLVFPDEMCFVIINNRGSNVVATIQLNNFFDRPRYYGTVFVLVFTIGGGLAIVANVSWQFYSIIIAPVGKHTEPIKVKREDPKVADAEAAMALTGTTPAEGSGRFVWYNKLVGKLRPNAVSAHQS